MAISRQGVESPVITDDRCRQDLEARERDLKDCGVSETVDGFERRVSFYRGFDHTAFPKSCGGGGHGRHGMEIAFHLIGPAGVTQWKIAMPDWVPNRQLDVLGNLPSTNSGLNSIYAVDLGYHWPTARYESQSEYECDLLPEGKCFYDGSGLNAGPVLRRFLDHGPQAVWDELRAYYERLSSRDEAA